jgi:uncharacterized membrane protein
MKKETWLHNEIDKWEQRSLITPQLSIALKDLYSPKRNTQLLVAVFSIIGSLLVGTGVILILAKNWYSLPMFLRVALAFLPLLLSQALAAFVIKRKYDSFVWRESAAILVTASVFAAIAIVGQVFHLPGDYGVYVLTCGLLSLPMIYILDASAPLIVYYWTILNWAGIEQSGGKAIVLIGLFAAGAAFVYIKRRQEGPRLQYMAWITLIAGFAAAIILGGMLESSLLLFVICYFALLLSAEHLFDSFQIPFMAIGLAGSLITVAILTYEGMWEYFRDSVSVGNSLLIGGMLATAIYFTYKLRKIDRLRFAFSLSLISICVLRYLWAALRLDTPQYSFIFAVFANIVFLLIGIGFVMHGAKHASLLTVNIGVAALCALIVMRFFDSNMDFFWRGVVSIALGTVFLLVNYFILRKKRHLKAEVEQ